MSLIASPGLYRRCALWLLPLLLCLPGPAASNGCDPSRSCCAESIPPGSPCGGAGVASQGNASGIDQGAGNPINLITGNKYQQEVDLPALPGVMGLEIVRHYNSSRSGADVKVGGLGRGWKLSYETELFRLRGNLLEIVQADGTRLLFERQVQGQEIWTGATSMQGKIHSPHKAVGLPWTWVWPDGRQLDFNAGGKLVQIRAPTGEAVQLEYNPDGGLQKVTDPQGRSLHLNHLPRKQWAGAIQFRGVQSIDSPVGRFSYHHGSPMPAHSAADKSRLIANLVRVDYPAGPNAQPTAISRHYHYEDPRYPTLLTGISIAGTGSDGQSMKLRLSSWQYDEYGRAVLSVKGEPARWEDRQGKRQLVAGTGVEQVSLQWPRRGEVVLTNSLGQQTRYKTARIAGQARILETRGAGCASCGPVNIRYAYDHLGRLRGETQLDAAGKPLLTTRTSYDGHGRPREVSSIAWVKGKPQAPRWKMRLRYPPHDDRLDPPGVPPSWPASISRPSVVAGKLHELSIRYNAQGQPLEMTESGWQPALASQGQPTPISRSTRYRYQMLAGRSLLAEVDGPLANGPLGSPADSDITRLQWDMQGRRIIAITAPGAIRSQIEYDASGRLQQLANNQDQRSSFAWTALGQLEGIQRTGPQRLPLQQQLRHDALGRNTETGETDHTGRYRARLRLGYDGAGRIAWQASALGMLASFRHDSESRLIEQSLGDSAMARVRQYEYDAAGRITGIHDNSGATTRIRYDARGFPLELSDALGRRQPLAAAARTSPGRRAIAPRQLKDDFGRLVAILSPDSGATVRQFDAADRLVGSTDARGNQAEYEYDLHGRILRQTIRERTDKGEAPPPSVTIWRYQGTKLVALEHATQDERYRHDERGLLSARLVSIRQPNGKRITSITRYLYNDAGLLQAVSLPDGSLIEYERNGQDQVIAVRRQRLQSAWLRWLLPRQLLVDQLERDLVGIRHARSGNGMQTEIQRSAQAVLARKLHRRASAIAQGEALAWLIRHARAGQPTDAPPPPLPGALGIPSDPAALLDWRYLWDAQGNLLHLRQVAGKPRLGNYAYDRRDRLAVAVHSEANKVEASRYFHDRQGRRLLAQEGIADQSDLKSHSKKAVYQPGTHRWLGADGKTVAYDPSGLPQSIGQRRYEWDALGRLRSVRQNGELLASYAYNHRGERVLKQTDKATQFLYQDGQLLAELDEQGLIRRQYVYLADLPLVVIDSSKGREPESEERGLFSRLQRDLRTIVLAWLGNDERMVWLHTNHLGAVEAATNQDGKPVWRATWQPSGRLKISSQGFALQLRLPGQYEDEETGLYYNRHRYYDPSRGAYLTPDPLGAPDGPNPYAYVRGNPLRYVDPSGLVLFAFDGTENSDPVLNPGKDSLSNVVLFLRLYNEDPVSYISGVGTVDVSDPARPIKAPPLDAGINTSGPERVARMVEYLGSEAELIPDTEVMNIDIVGFSRGAAQSRDFANRIVASTRMIDETSTGWYSYIDQKSKTEQCQLVRFRFMGLFDTVLSTNWSGYTYNLAIPMAFEYVAHAVALNEYRGHVLPLGRANVFDPHSWGAFPLESIAEEEVPAGRTRIELGFIGSHADIGGGFQDDALAKVALAWMVEQARLAGINMDIEPTFFARDPVLHDKSDAIRFGSPSSGSQLMNDGAWNLDYYIPSDSQLGTGAEDREVHYSDSRRNTTQRNMTDIGLSYADSEQFITYDDQRSRSDNVTGTVDIVSYIAWLRNNGYELGDLALE